jgi:hypothetical protein
MLRGFWHLGRILTLYMANFEGGPKRTRTEADMEAAVAQAVAVEKGTETPTDSPVVSVATQEKVAPTFKTLEDFKKTAKKSKSVEVLGDTSPAVPTIENVADAKHPLEVRQKMARIIAQETAQEEATTEGVAPNRETLLNEIKAIKERVAGVNKTPQKTSAPENIVEFPKPKLIEVPEIGEKEAYASDTPEKSSEPKSPQEETFSEETAKNDNEDAPKTEGGGGNGPKGPSDGGEGGDDEPDTPKHAPTPEPIEEPVAAEKASGWWSKFTSGLAGMFAQPEQGELLKTARTHNRKTPEAKHVRIFDGGLLERHERKYNEAHNEAVRAYQEYNGFAAQIAVEDGIVRALLSSKANLVKTNKFVGAASQDHSRLEQEAQGRINALINKRNAARDRLQTYNNVKMKEHNNIIDLAEEVQKFVNIKLEPLRAIEQKYRATYEQYTAEKKAYEAIRATQVEELKVLQKKAVKSQFKSEKKQNELVLAEHVKSLSETDKLIADRNKKITDVKNKHDQNIKKINEWVDEVNIFALASKKERPMDVVQVIQEEVNAEKSGLRDPQTQASSTNSPGSSTETEGVTVTSAEAFSDVWNKYNGSDAKLTPDILARYLPQGHNSSSLLVQDLNAALYAYLLDKDRVGEVFTKKQIDAKIARHTKNVDREITQ